MIEGLKRALEIIKKSKDELIKVDPKIALGMSHVEHMVNSEILNTSEVKKKVYVVSGFYFYNYIDHFEQDEVSQSIHTSLDDANKACELEFDKHSSNDVWPDVEIDTCDDGALYCMAYNDVTGCRIFVKTTAYDIKI